MKIVKAKVVKAAAIPTPCSGLQDLKISFCTTCMGRLHHLRETLPANLINTESYPNREFIILNYGSKDGLHEWIKEMKPWIDKGIVKYFRTQQPEFFVATHSKNIAHRQGTGEILCNVDADNFLCKGYVEFLAAHLANNDTIVAASPSDIFEVAGSCGKIAVRREHFYAVNGYDEDWNIGWGWDDTNFQYRARMHSNLKLVVAEKKWHRAIDHTNEERAMNFRDQDITKTTKMSRERLEEIAKTQDYIANKNREWGQVSDLSTNLE